MTHQTEARPDRLGSALERAPERPGTSSSAERPITEGVATLITDLPYGPRAAEVARGAVAVALHGADAALLADARLIGSELATNAFASGSPPLVLCVDRKSQPVGGLEVEITVTDGGCAHPEPAVSALPAEEAESGRGLFIVEALADAWSLRIGTGGTRAWCRLTRAASSVRPGA